MPEAADRIGVEIIDLVGEKDVFEISGRRDAILLKGNHAVSVASALYWYLKYSCHCHVSWNGDNLKLPEALPAVEGVIRKTSLFRYRAWKNSSGYWAGIVFTQWTLFMKAYFLPRILNIRNR